MITRLNENGNSGIDGGNGFVVNGIEANEPGQLESTEMLIVVVPDDVIGTFLSIKPPSPSISTDSEKVPSKHMPRVAPGVKPPPVRYIASPTVPLLMVGPDGEECASSVVAKTWGRIDTDNIITANIGMA